MILSRLLFLSLGDQKQQQNVGRSLREQPSEWSLKPARTATVRDSALKKSMHALLPCAYTSAGMHAPAV
jgi:hypothetical protein